jgi:Cys-tRNA(Pro)/Cys-tRNA(Cys) deacylase
MKKQFPTFIHETAQNIEKIFVSAGKVGFQIELSVKDLVSVVRSEFADVVCE